LAGSPVDLQLDYPQENSWRFQAFNVTADPWSARVYAGRTQGQLSELIAYEYDDAIPGSTTTYADWASAETMVSLPDAIDLDLDPEERHADLLFAHNPLPDFLSGQVMLVGAAYDIASANGGILSVDADLGPAGDCSHADGAFCFFSYWSDGVQAWSLPTDGAACIDPQRKIAVGSTVTAEAAGSGTIQFYAYDPDGNLNPQLNESGRMPSSGPYPMSMACH